MSKDNNEETYAPLVVQLVKAMNWAHRNMQHEIEKFDLAPFNLNQGIVLASIQSGINRPSALAREMNVSRQAISVILRELEERGIVEVVADPSHKLAKIVRIVDNPDILGNIRLARAQTEERLIKRIGEDNYRNLQIALEKDWGKVGDEQ